MNCLGERNLEVVLSLSYTIVHIPHVIRCSFATVSIATSIAAMPASSALKDEPFVAVSASLA